MTAISPIQPRKEPVQARSKARFETILEVSLDLIIEMGADTVTMQDIAKGANISIASLYQYFPDKASIIATLTERFNAAGQACVQTAFADVVDEAEFLKALYAMQDEYYACFTQQKGTMAIWQASLSDVRLQALNRQDDERHVQTVTQALLRVYPNLDENRALTLGRILSALAANTVRMASELPESEAQDLLEQTKTKLIAPALKTGLVP